jgi:hypothetical protein
MKSAYELAMERLNKDNPIAQLTEEQKAKLGMNWIPNTRPRLLKKKSS